MFYLSELDLQEVTEGKVQEPLFEGSPSQGIRGPLVGLLWFKTPVGQDYCLFPLSSVLTTSFFLGTKMDQAFTVIWQREI